jgi:nickel-dependent lactate racemase
MAVLRYGNNSSIELTLAADVIPGEVGIARGEPLADLGQAVPAALADPLDYPPLAQSILPADRVVLALDHGTPQLPQITASVVQTLVDSGVEPESISVLPSPADREARCGNPCRLLAASLRERITVLTHDPTDRRQLAYLAANAAGEAILVNRALHEADVVISIGCLRANETAGYFGIHGAIFPAFSDFKTIQRFRSLESLNGRGNRRRDLTAEAENVAWLLGVNFTIQVVPGAGDRVLHVLAGQSQSVERRGSDLYRAAWSWPVADRASLVVAGIEGDATQQTWENVGRTLQAAARFVEEDGAIVVCCDLAANPGPALRRVAHAKSPESALRHVEQQRPADALPAAQLAHALREHKVYLLSQLDPSVVEELDVIPIGKPEELNRLARQHGSCIMLSNAPYVTTIT